MPWQPQFIIQSANVKQMRKTQSFSFYLPEDALHEILIKLAPYTLYYFGRTTTLHHLHTNA